jgi:hypothetical protein
MTVTMTERPIEQDEWTELVDPRSTPRVKLLVRPLELEHDGSETFAIREFVQYEGDDCEGV